MSTSWEATNGFNRFIFVCFVGFCLNKMRARRNILTPLTRKTGMTRACGGMAVPTQTHKKKPKIGSKTGTARTYGGTAVPLTALKNTQTSRNMCTTRA